MYPARKQRKKLTESIRGDDIGSKDHVTDKVTVKEALYAVNGAFIVSPM